jgi:hypothetical protein
MVSVLLTVSHIEIFGEDSRIFAFGVPACLPEGDVIFWSLCKDGLQGTADDIVSWK